MWTVRKILPWTVLGSPLWGPVLGMGSEARAAEHAPARVELADHLTLTELAPSVWRISAEPWHANSLLAQLDDGTWLWADTPPTPDQTRRVLAWIEARTPGAAVVAAVSHHHLDASGGIQVLRAAGVPVYGGSLTPPEMAARSPGMTADLARSFADDARMTAAVAELEWQPPDHVFPVEGALHLRFGADEVVLLHPGAAHTADNIVVWLPRRGVLFGGCMVKAGDDLGYMGEAHLDTWGAAIERLQALGPRWVVPGHGPSVDPALLANTARLVVEARQAAPVAPE